MVRIIDTHLKFIKEKSLPDYSIKVGKVDGDVFALWLDQWERLYRNNSNYMAVKTDGQQDRWWIH